MELIHAIIVRLLAKHALSAAMFAKHACLVILYKIRERFATPASQELLTLKE